MTRPIRATIDPAALRHNHDVARRYAGDARLWSVVKANAYGHGLARVADALADVADGFALVELAGAVALRDAGIRQPILMLEGFYAADELATYAEYDLTSVVHSLAQVDVFRRYALPVRLPVYLKLNTGMNHLGLNPDDLDLALSLLMPCAGAISLMTHFADADGETGVSEQAARFDAMRKGRGLSVSLANSAALLRFAETRGDWARPGIMLYGCSPFPEMRSAEAIGLQPVMTLSSELIAIRDISAGDHVGYGGIFAATAPMRIGIVACGYADGYPRHAPTGTPILVDGHRTRTLGRVSMDKLCVDLCDLPGADVGTPVTLWGEGLSADEVAMPAGTVSYELFCAVAARVPVAVAG
jgi:alanine racemase